MADIEFIAGDGGQNYDITIRQSDGVTNQDLTAYTGATLTFKSADYNITKVPPITCSLPGGSIVRWAMLSSQTNFGTGNFAAQITLTGAGTITKTFWLTVFVTRSA